jgi:cobalt-zinc-cadmium efflux system protein
VADVERDASTDAYTTTARAHPRAFGAAGYTLGVSSPPRAETASDRKLAIALAITGGYMLVEAVSGLAFGSLALLSDAGHMLSDSGALAIALFASRFARQPPDDRHTMGHQRAEVLGAAVNAGALIVLSAWVSVTAVQRFGSLHTIDAGPMMATSALGLGVNVAMAWLLRGERVNLNAQAALLNVLSDALGSLGALGAGALIWWRGWLWADAAASLIIAGLILFGACRVLATVADVLMQAVPQGLDLAALTARIVAVPGVASLHDLHVWMLRPGEEVVSVHVVLDPRADVVRVCAHVHEALHEAVPSAHVTVQPECPPDAG